MTDLRPPSTPAPPSPGPIWPRRGWRGASGPTPIRATEPMHGAVPVADIHAEADTASERIDQLLHGEIFDVLDRRGGRVWGQARRDGTVGWMDAVGPAPACAPCRPAGWPRPTADLPLNALSPTSVPPTTAPDRRVRDRSRRRGRTPARACPHSLGARSSLATDCSGMVQQALLRLRPGRPAPFATAGGTRRQAVSRGRCRGAAIIVVWLDTFRRPELDRPFGLHAGREPRDPRHRLSRRAWSIEAFAEADARYRGRRLRARRLPPPLRPETKQAARETACSEVMDGRAD